MSDTTYNLSEENEMKIDVEFYELPNGTEPAKKFLDSLDKKLRAKMFREIDLLEENGPDLRMPHSRPVGNGIFELRTKQSSNISRVMYFFIVGQKAILTNGLVKKTDKTPRSVIDLAEKYRDDYYERFMGGEEHE